MKEKWNQLIEKYGKNKVYAVVAGIVAVIVLIIVLLVILLGGKKKTIEEFTIKKYTYEVELGEAVKTNIDNYVEIKDDKVEKSEIKFNFCGLESKKESCKDYTNKKLDDLKVGKYKATISYKEQRENITINVKDTKAPEFTKFQDTIIIMEGKNEVDFSSYFEAEDLDEVKVKINSSAVKYNVPGEYTITVYAEDASGNKSETKKVTVIVQKSEESKQACPGADDPNQECDAQINDTSKYVKYWIASPYSEAEVQKMKNNADEYLTSIQKDDDEGGSYFEINGKKYREARIEAIKRNDRKIIGYGVIVSQEITEESE